MWVFKNNYDEYNVIIKNKTRLAVHTLVERIDFDKTFAIVARL